MSSQRTPQEKAVLGRLVEKFGSISFDIIESVACAFNYNVDMSSKKLIEMTRSDSGQGKTTPPTSTRRHKTHNHNPTPQNWQTANRNFKKRSIKRDISVPTELNVVNMQDRRQRVREELLQIDNMDRVLNAIEHNYRVLILLRGLPGSGKTHLAHKILSLMGNDCDATRHICSADSFFQTKDGRYKFVGQMLPKVHDQNQFKAHSAMRKGVSPVIIDNTNLALPEMLPYAQMAMENGYYVEILEPKTYWKLDVVELAKRNKHSVPLDKIQRMKEKYEKPYDGYKLMELYNLRYIKQTPPVLRNIPPIAPPTETVSCSNLSYPCSGSDSQCRDYYEMVAEMNSVKPSRFSTQSTDNINLMDFNEIDDSDSKTANSAHDNDDVYIVDSPFPANSESNILQPHVLNNLNLPPIGQSKPNPVLSIDMEAAWGVSEQALQSWNFVTPLPESSGPRLGNSIKIKTIAQQTDPLTDSEAHYNGPTFSEVGCYTLSSDFSLCRVNDVPDGYKVLMAKSRDINEKTATTAPVDCVPKKTKFEKSCSVSAEDFEVKDKERDLQYLESVFNTTPKKYLKDMYETCGEELEWTAELLLEGGNLDSYSLAHSTDNEEDEEVGPAADTSTKKKKKCIKNKRKSGTKSDKSSPGLQRFKYDNDVIISRSPVPKPASACDPPKVDLSKYVAIPGTSNDVIYIRSSESDGSEPADEKMVELDLGDQLVKQLSELFRDNLPAYPEGFLPKVQVPLSLAQELFGGYIESAYQQRDNQTAVLNELVKQDEELARKIDEEQKSIDELTQSSSFLEESGVSESEFCKTATDSVVLRAIYNKLFTVFPDFDKISMAEVLKANDYKYLETLNTLLDSCPNDNVSKDPTIYEPPVSEETIEQMRLDEQTFEDDCNVDLEEIMEVQNIRSHGNKFYQDRVRFSENASKFLRSGQGEIAEFYSNFSQSLTKLFERANGYAVTRCMTQNGIKNNNNENTLDLHGLFVKEALTALDMFLDKHILSLQCGKIAELFIITGRGANSKNGIAKIKPEVIIRLRERELFFTHFNEGSLKVTVRANNYTTEEVEAGKPDSQENPGKS